MWPFQRKKKLGYIISDKGHIPVLERVNVKTRLAWLNSSNGGDSEGQRLRRYLVT